MTIARISRRFFAAAVATAAVLLSSPGPASASCASPIAVDDAVAQADLVVVGTVSSVRSRDRVAIVSVEEVWKGSAGATVEVFGGPGSARAATSVDRTWTVGQRYLVVAIEPRAHGYEPTFGGRYESSGCSATQPFTAAVAAHRPAGAAPPSESSGGGASAAPHRSGPSKEAGVIGWTAAAVLAAAAAATALRKRRQAPLELPQ